MSRQRVNLLLSRMFPKPSQDDEHEGQDEALPDTEAEATTTTTTATRLLYMWTCGLVCCNGCNNWFNIQSCKIFIDNDVCLICQIYCATQYRCSILDILMSGADEPKNERN